MSMEQVATIINNDNNDIVCSSNSQKTSKNRKTLELFNNNYCVNSVDA